MTKDQAFRNHVKPSEVSIESGSKFIGATFLYMLIALAITGVVSGLCGFLLQNFVYSNSELGGNVFVIVLFISLILYIPTLFWVQISAIRNGKTMWPAYIIYSAIMGVFISTFTAFIPFYVIAASFGLTCLAFAVMALIAWGTKRNLSTLAIIASGLISGALIIWLFYWLFSLITLSAFTDVMMPMIVSYIFFIAIILITIVDLNNVKRIAMNGGAANNVALLCALNLYVDFIYIFIRLLSLIIRLRRN